MRALLLLALLLPLNALATAVTLEGNTDALELVTSTSASIDYNVSWLNVTATALTTPGRTAGNVAAATTTTILAAPAASNWRHVRSIELYNAGTAVNTLTIQRDVSGTNRLIYKAVLFAGESITMLEDGQWRKFSGTGAPQTDVANTVGATGTAFAWAKSTTAADTTGYHYLMNKDPGLPSGQVWGTPGVNGNNTDCSSANAAATGAGALGSPYLPDPTGSLWLTNFSAVSAIANAYLVIDILWYNTGLTVTTTTEQTFTTPTWDARDATGATTGYGLEVAIYALTTMGNAAAISNSTVRYTNTDGTGSRTAVLTAVAGGQAPVTPLIGTFVPFGLQSGDVGITSIQGVTLATSYVSGTMGIIVFRRLGMLTIQSAGIGSGFWFTRDAYPNPQVRLYNNTCLGVVAYGVSAVTAHHFGGTFTIVDR